MNRIALLAGIAFLTGCSQGHKPQDAHTSDTPPRAVTIGQVERRPLGGSVSASGLLVTREEAAVSPEISGYRVAQVFVDEGDVVRKGQPLAALDPLLIEARLAQARAAVAEAQARAAQSASEAARVAGLDGSGILSDEQITSRRLQAESAHASVESAKAQLRDLTVQRTRMMVRAPVGGIVLQRTVRPGDIATQAGDPMFRLARDRLVELDAELPEDALDGFVPGGVARVTLPVGETIEGHVRFVSPRVDPHTKLGRIRIALPVNRRLRPGAFARVTLARPDTPISAVPEAAVQFEASGPLVVVVDRDGRAKRMPVRTGNRAGGWIALVQGPPAGTRVALGGGAFILDGDRVTSPVER
jgi:HlyD family secretion protein